MTVQIASEIINVNLSLGLANRGDLSICEVVESHKPQVTKIYETSKTILVERYQRFYTVEYCYVLGELEIWAIEGIADVEDTFNSSFIRHMEEAIELVNANSDNDEEYDETFQNQK